DSAAVRSAAANWRGHCRLHTGHRAQVVTAMRILICSDGMPASDTATRLGGIISRSLSAETVLLGIVENAQDEPALREALEREAQHLRSQSVKPKIVSRAGEPIRE